MALVARSLLLVVVVAVLGAGPVTAAPEGQLTYAVHITLVMRWLDPGDLEGLITPFMVIYALHDFSVGPPYFSLGETIVGYLQAVGIRTKLRTMERAAFFSAWGAKTLRGLSYGASGAHGSAATRIDSFVASGGAYTSGGYPDIDELARAQVRELDRRKREAALHQIQRLVYDRVMFAPMWQYTFLNGIGPNVADARFGSIASFPYTAPYEELRLRK